MTDVQVILRKVGNGEVTDLVDGLVAGRLPDSGLVLTEGHPSRRHAKFSLGDTGSSIEDLGSANGTFVNEQRIDGLVSLNPGDKIRFDTEEYEYEVVGDATIRKDADKTMIRQAEQLDVDIDGSEMREQPAWIGKDKLLAGGPKTEFIDASDMKQMMELDEQSRVDVSGDITAPVLMIVNGAKSGLRVNLKTTDDRGEWTIGCDADRDIVLEDQGVSGVHAKLSQDKRRWKLTDQMSANGTFVNSKRANMSYLDNGDRIRFGPIECVFMTPKKVAGATPRSSSVAPRSDRLKNILMAVGGFMLTLAVLYLLFRTM